MDVVFVVVVVVHGPEKTNVWIVDEQLWHEDQAKEEVSHDQEATIGVDDKF